ncbi:hypothetical protein ACETAC_08835 [Aceticella autotrophica]|uniref:Asp23/Gls24 family envelope stress response protein n=1 Tax=Aceticella autotrophica TaxID=2755338 RepID=A0A975G9W6_9THEO|nr:hypothetical protein [Aceticella autotrophica]MDI6603755.1 hypothetical protein [Thermoanaerobacteraceae bacterium]QSZ26964.1 hypothetical protein ACETAC_08835 [Aceticella autotrophica]
MKVYSFVGESGTGKSHHASIVAGKYNIKFIIDDGLLIYENRILSGLSAKKEQTKIAAIRRAIFLDPEHVKKVKKSIEELKPEKIMIIGTSDKMTDKIALKLGLPPVSKRIYIEEVVSPEEIDIAKRKRDIEGKHIIPVPAFEVKKQFSGYFIDPLRIFRRNREIDLDKTVIRPNFSYLGKYTISENVINCIVLNEAKKFKEIYKINKIITENYPEGVIIKIDLIIDYGVLLRPVLLKVIKYVRKEVEYMTSLNVINVVIFVRSLNVKKYRKKNIIYL